jgi:DnaJ-class molecular chaperone
MKDYYKILGVERTASTQGIKTAFYNLIKQFHPDVNPKSKDCVNKYLELVEAYKILGNLDNRLKYSSLLNKKIQIPKYYKNYEL